MYSSFANGSNRTSIYGFVIYVNEQVLHYKYKVQPLVIQSSTNAEFVAMALTIKEVKWILQVLEELQVLVDTSLLFCDNQGAIKIVQNRSATARSKHIDITLQSMKYSVLEGVIKVRYVQSSDNVADLFTKSLGRLQFYNLRASLLCINEHKNKGGC